VRRVRPPRILVVDDEPAVRALIVCALQEAGYEGVAVKDGKPGLEAARSAGVPYDLVLTNSYMPTMTGELSLTESPLLGHQLAHLL
jgi:CheY-like chemotaxis protein